MKNKFTVEVTGEEIKRTLIYEDYEFKDTMVKKRPGCWETIGTSIESQLEEFDEETGYDTEELSEAIEDNNYEYLMELLNE